MSSCTSVSVNCEMKLGGDWGGAEFNISEVGGLTLFGRKFSRVKTFANWSLQTYSHFNF